MKRTIERLGGDDDGYGCLDCILANRHVDAVACLTTEDEETKTTTHVFLCGNHAELVDLDETGK